MPTSQCYQKRLKSENRIEEGVDQIGHQSNIIESCQYPSSE
jgi:hypothetical protein